MITGKSINTIINVLLPVSSRYVGSPRSTIRLGEICDLTKDSISIEYNNQNSRLFIDRKISEFFNISELADSYPFFVVKLLRARVWGRNGAVITQKDQFITDVSREFNKGLNIEHSVFYTIKQKKPQIIKGNCAVIGTAGANIYYHWMMDVLPRLGIISKQVSLSEIDYFITEFNAYTFQVQTFEILNIPLKKIIASNDNWNFHIEAEQLWVPSLAGPLDQPTAYQVEYLRELFKEYICESGGNRRLYISRRKEGRRTIVNEDSIIAELKKRGFDIVVCEELTVKEQVKLFSEAQIIIGPHGSAFTNLVFCKPGTKVLDIFSNSHINPCFWFLSQIRELDYHFMVGSSAPIDTNPKNDNVVVDMPIFMHLLLELGI